MSSRDLSVCCSIVREGVPQMQAAYAASNTGRQLRPIQTLRSRSEQMVLYAQGRANPGKIVTYADGVRTLSNHQAQLEHGEFACHACDLGIFDTAGAYIQDEPSYECFRDLAPAAGLTSGYEFPKADPDHVQCPHGGVSNASRSAPAAPVYTPTT